MLSIDLYPAGNQRFQDGAISRQLSAGILIGFHFFFFLKGHIKLEIAILSVIAMTPAAEEAISVQ